MCPIAMVTRPPCRRWPAMPAPRPLSRTCRRRRPAPSAPPPDLTAAAFFDVDNTMMQGASIFHFARGLAARKFFTTSDMLDFVWQQVKFRIGGRENSDGHRRPGRRHRAVVRRRAVRSPTSSTLGEEIYDELMADRIWAGTRALAQMHLDAGQRVWLVTATPVRAGRDHRAAAGADRCARHGRRDAWTGIYTGRLVGDVLHGPAKAHAVRALAVREGLNLRRCTAYSDSRQRRADAVAGRHGGGGQPGRRPARRRPRTRLADPRLPHRAQGGADRGAVGPGARRGRAARWPPIVSRRHEHE